MFVETKIVYSTKFKKMEKNTSYPGVDLIADIIATATICCRIDICPPRIEFIGT